MYRGLAWPVDDVDGCDDSHGPTAHDPRHQDPRRAEQRTGTGAGTGTSSSKQQAASRPERRAVMTLRCARRNGTARPQKQRGIRISQGCRHVSLARREARATSNRCCKVGLGRDASGRAVCCPSQKVLLQGASSGGGIIFLEGSRSKHQQLALSLSLHSTTGQLCPSPLSVSGH